MRIRRNRGTPERPGRRWPRLAALVGVVLAVTLAAAACAGGGGKSNGVASLSGSKQPTATTNAGGSKDFKQAALDFARCMRQHGIDMPDPQFNGNMVTQQFKAGPGRKGADDPAFKAAQEACKKYMPNGGQAPRPDPQLQQKLVAFARCMRQHGIDMPDPNPNGGGIEIQGKSANPDDPKFKAAQQACQQYLPNAGKGGGFLTSNSGGGK